MSKDLSESNGLIGGTKSVVFNLSLTDEKAQTCSLSLVLARPWLFKGFNVDGSIDDPSSVLQNYRIPVWV